MHHAMADTEDPTTQIAWPSRTMNEPSTNAPSGNSQQSPPAQEGAKKNKKQLATKRRLSTWNLITLSISMAGAQIAWTVELGYGTPFLLTLGISEQVTSLVWLAGPISGLIAQPVIGAISDSSTSKWRRRSWIIGSTVVLVLVTLVLAYCEALAAFFVDLVGVGAGDWDERRNKQVVNVAIGLAVASFYLLDFALNALQASLRNLLLDITPAAQLNSGNAWHGRMTHAGNIIGFGFGFLPLAEFPLLKIFGGSQFRKFCILCNLILVITVGITCFCHTEEERPAARKESKFREVLDNIYTAIVNLPRPIRRVCYVQLFAFMGWFPFLFYSTTYVAQIMAREIGGEPDSDFATRKGELAMLFYSIVGVISGTILPHLASRDRRLMAHKEDVDEDAEVTRIRHTVREWRAEAARKGKPLRLPVMPFLLRNIWTGAMLWFSFLTFMTFFVDTVLEASLFVALVGISWAVAMWAPFAIIMELLKEISNPTTVVRPTHTRTLSTPPTRVGEQQPLLTRRRSYNEFENGPDDMPSATPVAGGTILGVHNLAIVMPQFIVSLAASIIFRVVDKTIDDDPANEHVYFGKNGVAWVLRFGGLCTLFGALLARRVPPTPTEKAMRRRLGEMRLLQSGNTP